MIITPITYYVAITGVAECIAAELDAHVADDPGTLGRPARVGIVPGAEVPWDGCQAGCGQLALAVQHGPYPSLRFPVEVLEDNTRGNCELGSTAMRVVASLTRCEYHPQGGLEAKRSPTMTEQANAALLQQVEGFWMRQAIICCLSEMKTNRQISDWRIAANDYVVNGACGEVAIVFYLNVT